MGSDQEALGEAPRHGDDHRLPRRQCNRSRFPRRGRDPDVDGSGRRADLEIDPEFADAHNILGIVLARAGKLDDAVAHLEKAAAKTPGSVEYQFNLGRVLAARSSFREAIPHFEKAVELSGGRETQSLEMLAAMYSEMERFEEAAQTARRALEIATRENNAQLAEVLRARIAQYESKSKR